MHSCDCMRAYTCVLMRVMSENIETRVVELYPVMCGRQEFRNRAICPHS